MSIANVNRFWISIKSWFGVCATNPRLTRIRPTTDLGRNRFDRSRLVVKFALMLEYQPNSTVAHLWWISVSTFVLFHNPVSLLLGLRQKTGGSAAPLAGFINEPAGIAALGVSARTEGNVVHLSITPANPTGPQIGTLKKWGSRPPQ